MLKTAGQISGYQHTFTLDDALKALSQYPLMVGSVWLQCMFDPAPDGLLTVDPTSPVAGGHEYVVDEYDAARDVVGITNSWGPGWGVAGRAYMRRVDLGWLLDQQGDVIVLLPVTTPAPAPTPANPDAAFAAVLRRDGWALGHHVGDNARVARAAQAWLSAKEL